VRGRRERQEQHEHGGERMRQWAPSQSCLSSSADGVS
jgi:hypothetical protein